MPGKTLEHILSNQPMNPFMGVSEEMKRRFGEKGVEKAKFGEKEVELFFLKSAADEAQG